MGMSVDAKPCRLLLPYDGPNGLHRSCYYTQSTVADVIIAELWYILRKATTASTISIGCERLFSIWHSRVNRRASEATVVLNFLFLMVNRRMQNCRVGVGIRCTSRSTEEYSICTDADTSHPHD